MKPRFTVEYNDKTNRYEVVEWTLKEFLPGVTYHTGAVLSRHDTKEEAFDVMQCEYHDHVYALQHADIFQ